MHLCAAGARLSRVVFPGQRQLPSRPGPAPAAPCGGTFRSAPGCPSPVRHAWPAAPWAGDRPMEVSWLPSTARRKDAGTAGTEGRARERHPHVPPELEQFQAGAGMSPHSRQERRVAGSSPGLGNSGSIGWDSPAPS